MKTLGTSAFWILFLLITLGGLSYLGVWSIFNNSVQGIAISFIFFAMIVFGILFSKFEIFDSGTWSQNALSFTIGFWLWAILAGGTTKSVLALTQNDLFASISSQLPQFLEFVMNAFVIPVAEEMFWIIGIPYALIALFDLLGKKYDLFSNKWLQLLLIIIIGGVTFASFHVGKSFLLFLLSAFLFRTIMIVGVIGDSTLDVIPFISLLPAFAVGSHIGNNFSSYGLVNGTSLLFGGNIFIALIISGIFVALFYSGIRQLLSMFGVVRA